MKKTLNILLVVFVALIGCKKEPKNSIIIIKFNNNIYLPKNFFSKEVKEYDELQMQYDSIYDNKFRYLNSKFTTIFKDRLNAIFNENVVLEQIFDKRDIKTFYSRVASARRVSCAALPPLPTGLNLQSNLQNYFRVSVCISKTDCDKFVAILSRLGIRLGFTVTCNEPPRPGSERSLIPPTPINNRASIVDFRSIMGINTLNSSTSPIIKGRDSYITLLENSQQVNFAHSEISHLSGTLNSNFGYGGDPAHSTATFGLIFANHASSGDSFANFCKGIAPLSVPNIVYFSFNDCGRTPYYYNALLRAIVNTPKGGVLLIEFDLADGPVETDIICKYFIQAAIYVMGVTVIEPIGNSGKNLDRMSYSPFDGILVGAASPSDTNYNVTSGVNYSLKSTTCFGIGDGLLTTNVRGRSSPPNTYQLYGSSSGASAIIAGLASCMQGYYFQKSGGCYLTPQQMKEAFQKCGGISVSGFTQKIPNAMLLKKYIDENFLRIAP